LQPPGRIEGSHHVDSLRNHVRGHTLGAVLRTMAAVLDPAKRTVGPAKSDTVDRNHAGLDCVAQSSGHVLDEARQAGRDAASLPMASEDYFHDMDGGIPLTVDEVKGRNTWIVWTGGNDRRG